MRFWAVWGGAVLQSAALARAVSPPQTRAGATWHYSHQSDWHTGYPVCGTRSTGEQQSPVDISRTVQDTTLRPLALEAPPATAGWILSNNGHSIVVTPPAGDAPMRLVGGMFGMDRPTRRSGVHHSVQLRGRRGGPLFFFFFYPAPADIRAPSPSISMYPPSSQADRDRCKRDAAADPRDVPPGAVSYALGTCPGAGL
jgi:hypothetical protein